MLWRFDKKTLDYKKDYRVILYSFLATLFVGITAFVSGRLSVDYSIDYVINENMKNIPIGSKPWIDSTFAEYETHAKIYLSQQRFKDTPIKPEMLRLAAYNAYERTGVLLPVELALSQAQIESSMGTAGKSPKNNPYNIGEYDTGTVMWFENTYDGIEAYYTYMCKNYLKCKSIDLLFKNFTNCNGQRYASNPKYESEVSKQYKVIAKYIAKHNDDEKN